MEVIGKIKKVFKTQTFDSGFKKRELIVTTLEQFPQDISIEFLKDKTEVLNQYKEGDNVKVSINLRGREWTNPEGVTRYFNSIVGWRVEKQENAPEINNIPPVDMSSDSKGEDFEDLPF